MSTPANSDHHTAHLILSGNKKAFRHFYSTYHPRLLAYTTSRVKTKEDAEEITHDAFLGFLDSLPLFSFRSTLWTFLVSIARHEISDYYRRLYAKKAIKSVPFLNQVYQEPIYSMNETKHFFDQALQALSYQQQNILIWKYEDGLSVAQIAAKLNTTVKATESRLFRARQAFQLAYVQINH